MNLRPAISAPLPWLALLASKTLGRKAGVRGVIRMPRSLSVTREGKWYIGVLFAIGIAAINTGNNLLYLVVATLLSLIIISGLLSESTLRGLMVARTLPKEAFKGRAAIVKYRIENSKKLVPSYSFHIREAVEHVSMTPLYLLKIDAGKTSTRAVEYTFLKRGLVRLPGLKVSTRFPFGLFVKGKVEREEEELLVYPSIAHKKGIGRLELYSYGESRPAGKGSGGELYGLRDYTSMDDSRRIYWRSAARTQKLLLKEFEKETELRVTVVFDNYPTTAPEEFEELVDEAATLANGYIESGCAVSLRTLSASIGYGTGRDHLSRILRTLALATPEGEGRAGVRVS